MAKAGNNIKTAKTDKQQVRGSRKSASKNGILRRSRKSNANEEGFIHGLFGYSWWMYSVGALLIVLLYVFLFYYFFVGPFSFKWKAIYQETTYPEGYNIRGIDISHYQKRINWESLRNESINNDPIRFVFIKATEGEKLMDEDFNENFYQAGENGFIRGAYHFYVPGVDIRKQAEFYMHMVHLMPGDLPPVLDVEKTGELTDKQIKSDVKTWLEIVGKRYNVKPIIYTSYKFRTNILNDSVFDKYPLWLAHYYIDKMKYTGKWAFWQHTDCGKLGSIKGFVDLDIFNGNMQDLMDMTIKEKEGIPD